MEAFEIFRSLAIIIIAAKVFGVVAKKLKAPQVVGEIIAGLVVGPCILNWVAKPEQGDFLYYAAEIGVVLLMFSAGLGTDLESLMKTGFKAFLIACAGVFIPLVMGTVYYECMYGFAPFGSAHFWTAVFIGTIMTATSVSITVEALKEMGYLSGTVGTTIMSAAIIDDVIGIVVLTFVLSTKEKSGSASPLKTIILTVLFFVLAFIVGFIVYKVFKKIEVRYKHKRRIAILGLGLAFALAYVSEKFFGIADITGAYVAGIILCHARSSDYIAEKTDINSYMLFGPLFFASIGLKTDISGMNMKILWFSIGFVLVAMVGKIIGCSLIAKSTRFKWEESLKIGIGMMTRGEVALIVAQKGLDAGFIDGRFFTSVILLIIVSSITVPIFLKILYTKFPEKLEEAK